MMRLLEGILKKHFQWKDSLLSRRDFFTLLLPFSRKKCRLCGEERAVAGPYCPTCARRQMIPLLITFLLLAISQTAGAFDYRFDSSSYFFFSKDRNANIANNFYLPLYQYLDADLTKLGHESFSIHVSGWGRGDFTSRGAGDRGDGDLLYGYLQWQDPSTPRRIVRVGRQFFFGGPSSLRTQYVDGLYFKLDIAKGFGVELLGGSPIASSIGGRGGDFLGQGRAYHVWQDKAEIGVGYLNSRDSGERSSEDVGIDFWFYPFGKVELYGYAFYDVIGKDFADANLTATFFPGEKFKMTTDVGYTVPTALLPHTSLFSIFSNASYEKLGVAGTWFYSDRITLDGDLQLFHYSAGGNVARFGAQSSFQYGEEKQGRISLAAHRLDQLENGVSELRLFNSHLFGKKLSTSADLYLYLFDQAIRNRDFSFSAIGSTGYEIIKDLKVVGSLFYSQNPLFNNEFRGMVRVLYGFGGST